MKRLNGKTAIITGGAGEIGRTIASRFLAEGATVILTGRTERTLQSAVFEILAAQPADSDRLHHQVMDSADPGQLSQGINEITSRFEEIDILVNNAGSAGPKSTIGEMPLAASESEGGECLSQAIDSLLIGPWLITQALLPSFRPGASVINVSTIFSKSDYFGRAAYTVPKAVLNTLGKYMGRELGLAAHSIRVNTVLPGPVETQRIHAVFEAMDGLKELPQGTTEKEVLGRMLLCPSDAETGFVSREQIADTIPFLASDESRGITGQELPIARGYRIPETGSAHILSAPTSGSVDLTGKLVWIFGGTRAEESIDLARASIEAGAEVIISLSDAATLNRARKISDGMTRLTLEVLPEGRREKWKLSRDLQFRLKQHASWSAFVLSPSTGKGDFPVFPVKAGAIEALVGEQVEGPISFARNFECLLREYQGSIKASPTVVFFTDHQSQQELRGDIRHAAIDQLIRVWRGENDVSVQAGRQRFPARIFQLTHPGASSEDHSRVAADWALKLANGTFTPESINLCIRVEADENSRISPSRNSTHELSMAGLHLQKVTLITGGSEGIGGEISRQMALSGSKIVIAERNAEKLEKAKNTLVRELKEAGFSEPEKRILLLPDCDVANPETLRTVVDLTVTRFGRIDFLVNNAGLVGAEQMVVDIPVSTWNQTLMGNMTSNYDLISHALPYMTKQKQGHIINMSSYFVGGRHGYVSYTNRADYAVSKAGQMALTELLTHAIGPDVQINTLAPGPVDGARLKGTYGRPGLYYRRSKLILEGKRLNLVYKGLVEGAPSPEETERLVQLLACNDITHLAQNKSLPEPLARSIAEISASPPQVYCGAKSHLLTRQLAARAISRLKLGKRLPPTFSDAAFVASFVDAPEPFYAEEIIQDGVHRLQSSTMKLFALGRMPKDSELACEVVCSLAHHTVTGETIYPSCGYRFDGFTLDGSFRFDGTPFEVTRNDRQSRQESGSGASLAGQTVVIFGNSMFAEMTTLAEYYFDREGSLGGNSPKQVVIVTETDHARKLVQARLGRVGSDRITVLSFESDTLDAVFDRVVSRFGNPDVVISMPFSPMESVFKVENGNLLPSKEDFRALVNTHITNHFLLARRAALIDACRMIIVTQPVSQDFSPFTRECVRFVRKTLRPLTITAGKEAFLLPHQATFYQVEGDDVSASYFETILRMSLPTGVCLGVNGSVRKRPLPSAA